MSKAVFALDCAVLCYIIMMLKNGKYERKRVSIEITVVLITDA